MKYLPKSKLGAVAAALYLLLLGFLLVVAATGDKGLHSGTGLLLLLVFFLTMPWSWAALRIMDYISPSPPTFSMWEQITVYGALALCAVINSAIIYLAVGFASRGIRALFKKPLK